MSVNCTDNAMLVCVFQSTVRCDFQIGINLQYLKNAIMLIVRQWHNYTSTKVITLQCTWVSWMSGGEKRKHRSEDLCNCENINLQITARVMLITALYFRYKGLISQRSWQESRNDFEAKRSFLEFSKRVYFKM